MKNMKKLIALALVAVTIVAVALPTMALEGSYVPYLGVSTSSGNIRQGHTGKKVKNLQMLRNAVLFTHLEIDGVFGSATLNAVLTFQRNYMPAGSDDGIVGGRTKAALWSVCPVMPNLILL